MSLAAWIVVNMGCSLAHRMNSAAFIYQTWAFLFKYFTLIIFVYYRASNKERGVIWPGAAPPLYPLLHHRPLPHFLPPPLAYSRTLVLHHSYLFPYPRGQRTKRYPPQVTRAAHSPCKAIGGAR